ncbi:DMT family transporter [Kiloniella laminariae]|uniref:DMT family transporter n=1 Tax=Kiloniella laminariae TaxID=454162 RepID=A0ABT4LHY5_9PROT|nr:DMT family transporter [Kiloniella laminariae]MCZ4280717.1 DMT family transporter [Kiloniella laminariae]
MMPVSSENTVCDRKHVGGENRIRRIIGSSAFLLLVTGTLIGFNFPLGKIAGEAGVSPMIWALLVSLGASAMLLPVQLLRRRLVLPKGRMLRYVIFSALISFVLPNVLLFSVIPHVGSGYAGLMFALSPVFTLTLAVVFRQKTPGRIGLVGIGLGLIGAMIVSITRGAAPEAPEMIWIIVALLVPATLACGNIYRTMDWPDQAQPDGLAFWSHSFALVVYLLLLLASEGAVPLEQLSRVPWTAVAQGVVAGLTFPVFFRLQQHGGPVLLSQIGYVAAAVGLLVATAVLGEVYSAMTWLGAGVIALGIAVTIIAQTGGGQSRQGAKSKP